MRVKHATLGKDAEGNIIFVYPSQNKKRDTSASYSPYTNVLVIAGKTIEKHPKFPNVDKFEGFVNTYFAEGKDENELQNKEVEVMDTMNIQRIKGDTYHANFAKKDVASFDADSVRVSGENYDINWFTRGKYCYANFSAVYYGSLKHYVKFDKVDSPDWDKIINHCLSNK